MCFDLNHPRGMGSQGAPAREEDSKRKLRSPARRIQRRASAQWPLPTTPPADANPAPRPPFCTHPARHELAGPFAIDRRSIDPVDPRRGGVGSYRYLHVQPRFLVPTYTHSKCATAAPGRRGHRSSCWSSLWRRPSPAPSSVGRTRSERGCRCWAW